ncbi:DNA-binding response regulator [filamentous cyanobacterium CCP5]|nr:DNA-binding response regulator [filamentous cyanobacterium CCP5]
MEPIRVVLVEDHNLTRMGLRTALKQHGMDFLGEASNGSQGVELVERTKPDVAIFDIGLPDMDGIELTRRVRQAQAEDENAHTRILILTMHDSEDVVLAAFGAGADSYCTKGIETEDLIFAVEETAAGNSWIDPTIASIVLGQVRKPVGVGSEAEMVEIEAVDSEYRNLIETYPLTARELEILELIAAGCSNADIGEKLYITVGTVKTHVRSILNKLCVNDRTQAAVRALRSGLIK